MTVSDNNNGDILHGRTGVEITAFRMLAPDWGCQVSIPRRTHRAHVQSHPWWCGEAWCFFQTGLDMGPFQGSIGQAFLRGNSPLVYLAVLGAKTDSVAPKPPWPKIPFFFIFFFHQKEAVAESRPAATSTASLSHRQDGLPRSPATGSVHLD